MTLCLAWRESGTVYFASDSRVSLESGPFDHGIKISSIPVTIRGVGSPGGKYANQPLEMRLGLCFAGSFMNAYTTKEVLLHLCASLQAIPEITDVSMDQLCILAQKVSKFVSKQLGVLLLDKALTGFFLTGFCPRDGRFRTFKFEPSMQNKLEVNFTEILKTDGDIEFIGSGRDRANQLFKGFAGTPPLDVLRQVINDPNEKLVGGAIQFGRTTERDFKVFGVVEYGVDDVRREVSQCFGFAGISLMENPFVIQWDEFHPEQTFIDPFREETNRLLDSGYTMITTTLP